MNKNHSGLAVALIGLTTMMVPGLGSAKTSGPAVDVADVRKVGEQWKSLYENGDFSAIPELYTRDTIVMPRGRPRIEGREAMRRSVGGLAAGRKVNIEVTEREISVVRDFAWFLGDFKVTYTSADASTPPRTEFGRSLILFRRDADRRWRIHRDIDAPAPAPDVRAAAASKPAVAPVLAATPSVATPSTPRMWNPADRTQPTACDRMTASRYDRQRLAKPVAREDMDVPAVIRQCEADLLRYPGDPRIHFQLGRVYGYTGDQAKTLEHRRAAAVAGNHNAIFLLGYLAWIAAKNDQARCAAAREMRLAADRGNYSAQLTYASLFLEERFSMCADVGSIDQISAYVKAARPAVDGFFETRLADHLGVQFERAKSEKLGPATKQ